MYTPLLVTEALKEQKVFTKLNQEVPFNKCVPEDLENLVKLQIKPTVGLEENVEDLLWLNEAFIYFVEHLLPTTAGAKGWQEEMCSKPLFKMKITPSDEAFTLLCCENMWEKWNEEEETYKQPSWLTKIHKQWDQPRICWLVGTRPLAFQPTLPGGCHQSKQEMISNHWGCCHGLPYGKAIF